MKRVNIGDIVLAVQDAGVGPPLLFLHGFPLDHSMWAGQVGSLARRYRVIVPDLRGFGKSEVTEGVTSMDALADDMDRLLTALDVTTPVVLAGLSMGGYIAWQFWRRHPRRLRGLVLCDTRALPDSEEVARGRLQTAERVLLQGPVAVAEPMLERLFAPATRTGRPEVVAAVRQVILGSSPLGIAAALRGMAQRPDVTPWLPEIRVPALLVCGQFDGISPPAEMRAIAAAMPSAQYVEIPNAGHMSPLEQPAAFDEAFGSWAQSLGF